MPTSSAEPPPVSARVSAWDVPTDAVTIANAESESPWLIRAFAAAILLSAALLFLLQPMFGRMILPKLGGTPAVWNTCLVFFQATLLLGYLYAHLGTVRLSTRHQVWVHLALMAVTLAFLPIGVSSAAPPPEASPVRWLLTTLATSVGLPFFTLAATAPLLQRWFALASHRDPYVLYAASNVGSLVGLLGYPLVIERAFTLTGQSSLWFAGFAMLAVLIASCGLLSLRARTTTSEAYLDDQHRDAVNSSPASDAITWRLRAQWVALAVVPSSLLLGVTTYISTDVAAVPLLWVVPLALYLMTFIAAFASRSPLSQLWATRAMPFFIIGSI